MCEKYGDKYVILYTSLCSLIAAWTVVSCVRLLCVLCVVCERLPASLCVRLGVCVCACVRLRLRARVWRGWVSLFTHSNPAPPHTHTHTLTYHTHTHACSLTLTDTHTHTQLGSKAFMAFFRLTVEKGQDQLTRFPAAFFAWAMLLVIVSLVSCFAPPHFFFCTHTHTHTQTHT